MGRFQTGQCLLTNIDEYYFSTLFISRKFFKLNYKYTELAHASILSFTVLYYPEGELF